MSQRTVEAAQRVAIADLKERLDRMRGERDQFESRFKLAEAYSNDLLDTIAALRPAGAQPATAPEPGVIGARDEIDPREED